MKKIYLILSFLFCAATCFAQFPISQSLGSPSTLVYSKGGQGFDSLLVFKTSFSDTSQPNKGFLKNIAGGVIRVGNSVYIRNSTATAWLPFAIGSTTAINIYNSDGLLTGDRLLSGSSTHALTFDSLSLFNTFSYIDNDNYTQIQQDPNEVSLHHN